MIFNQKNYYLPETNILLHLLNLISAFDNQAYLSMNLDSGFDSSPSSYENVPRSIDSDPSYENIEEELEALSYENIEPPLTYQNALKIPDHTSEEYENLKFDKTELTANDKGHKAIPVYATLKKPPKISEEEESPVYENYDFQEQAIYQNMMVSGPKGRLVPSSAKVSSAASTTSGHPTKSAVKSNDVYAQVKFLRMSVQEVNAIIEQEVPNLSKRSELVIQRAKELDDHSKSTHFVRTSNTGSVKRSSNFKSILYKFNVMSQQQHGNSSSPSQEKKNKKGHH